MNNRTEDNLSGTRI